MNEKDPTTECVREVRQGHEANGQKQLHQAVPFLLTEKGAAGVIKVGGGGTFQRLLETGVGGGQRA
jgi:hypothetical protein